MIKKKWKNSVLFVRKFNKTNRNTLVYKIYDRIRLIYVISVFIVVCILRHRGISSLCCHLMQMCSLSESSTRRCSLRSVFSLMTRTAIIRATTIATWAITRLVVGLSQTLYGQDRTVESVRCPLSGNAKKSGKIRKNSDVDKASRRKQASRGKSVKMARFHNLSNSNAAEALELSWCLNSWNKFCKC